MSKLLFTISGETMEDVRNSLKQLAAGFGLAVTGGASVEASQPMANSGEPEVKKSARKQKAEAQAEPQTAPLAATSSEETAGTEAQTVTKDDLNAAVRELIQKGKADVARQTLSKFGAANIKELKPTDYGKVMETLKASIH